MQSSLVNIGLGFIEGLALIVSPCILPILPIILAGSLVGDKRRPFGIITSFILVFAIFTFFSRKIVLLSGIDLNLIRHISYGILLMLGVIMISTVLTDRFNILTQRLANIGSSLSSVNDANGGFLSGLIFGGLIALIWTPCAGPILAAVIVQTVIQQSNFLGFLTMFAFAVGAAVPMLIIAVFGRSLTDKLGYLKSHTGLLRKLLGVIIIFSVIYMIAFESGISAIPKAVSESHVASNQLERGLAMPYPAPDIGNDNVWINSPPLQISDLKGKVVLIDFMTYSCINCIRTFPYLIDWYKEYHDQGFEVIGIHAPEFEFEKNIDNVKKALKADGIEYPVALDNQFTTWRNYKNQYWPAHYLIDKDGNVVYVHFGEGAYDITESNIRYLLGIKESIPAPKHDLTRWSVDQTPETYMGYARAERFASNEAMAKNAVSEYSFPKHLAMNNWALQGKWKIAPDKIISESENAALEINFHAREVYMVLGNSTHKPITVRLKLDGKDIDKEGGKDVSDSTVIVNSNALYELIDLDESGSGNLQLSVHEPGLEVFTFTFGG